MMPLRHSLVSDRAHAHWVGISGRPWTRGKVERATAKVVTASGHEHRLPIPRSSSRLSVTRHPRGATGLPAPPPPPKFHPHFFLWSYRACLEVWFPDGAGTEFGSVLSAQNPLKGDIPITCTSQETSYDDGRLLHVLTYITSG